MPIDHNDPRFTTGLGLKPYEVAELYPRARSLGWFIREFLGAVGIAACAFFLLLLLRG